MAKFEDTIYSYRNQRRTTEFKLQGTPEGIVVSCISVFDQDTWETDTHMSRPFSCEGMGKALDELIINNRCCFSEGDQVLTIVKQESGSFSFSFDGGGFSNRFDLHGVPFDPVVACRKLSLLDA